jgi:ketosteroid isomerase-like protein
MNDTELKIKEMVERETRAWNTQDAESLISIFHPDMVWPWPKDAQSHNPVEWVFPLGRYDRARWKEDWQILFDTYTLVHNHRTIIKIMVSEQQDGGFAFVDVYTLWRHKATGEDFHWKGRACKGYTKVAEEWKLIFHTGLLEYADT